MGYRVSVFINDSETEHHLWYANFKNANFPIHFRPEVLAQYNAIDIWDSPFLEFETEQDFMMFVLKFS